MTRSRLAVLGSLILVATLAASAVALADAPRWPLGQWVRTTVYVNYLAGEMRVWMDGAKVFDASFSRPTRTMCQFHWGLYASPNNSDITYYEDDVTLYKLLEPLSGTSNEPWLGEQIPVCP